VAAGAWGFTHVALVRRLHERGVPIDLIAGSSMGSMVGAYYCAMGLRGLDLLVERALRGDISRGAPPRHPLHGGGAAQGGGRPGAAADRRPAHPLPRRADGGGQRGGRGGAVGTARARRARQLLGAGDLRGHADRRPPLRRRLDEQPRAGGPGPGPRRGPGPGRQLYPAAGGPAPAPGRPRREVGRDQPLARITDFLASADLLLHRSGRRGGAAADVLYEITPKERPLAWARDFRKGRGDPGHGGARRAPGAGRGGAGRPLARPLQGGGSRDFFATKEAA